MIIKLLAISAVWSSFLVIVLTSPADGQDCTPTSQENVLWAQGCVFDYQQVYAQNTKTSRFDITWPDGFTDSRNNSGFGQCFKGTTCSAPSQEIDCWPQFDSPVAMPNGSWSQTVRFANVVGKSGTNSNGRPCYSYSCGLTGQVNKSPASHTCTCDCAQGQKCCNGTCVPNSQFCGGTPIVLDPLDEGFHLTSLSNGVQFRVLPGGPLQQMSWTDANWHNGWLALDRNGDGTIDDFTELFGDLTPQPPSSTPNGFLALAVFDDPANGGNGNGFIDPGDAVYSRLRVWIDANHNGISEPNELHTLQELGIFKIGLKFHETPFVDQFGNQFRYKGSVWDGGGNDDRDKCYDVFLQIQVN